MKNIFFLILILTSFSCQEPPATNTEMYIYLDYSEGQDYSEQVHKDLDKYLELMNVSTEQNRNFGKIKIYPIHDIGTTESKTIKLKEGKSKMEGNRFVRNKEIEKFKTKFVEGFNLINSNFAGEALSNSQIFRPISKGVKKLNKSNADRKVVIIYSDMLENSDLVNLHNAKVDYEALKDKFNDTKTIDDVSECEFYIVHPLDKKNDAKIRNAGALWVKYLTEKGLDEDNYHFDTSIDI